jgi:hypothetical protein
MERMTLSELGAVLIEAEKTGRPIEMNALSNTPDTGWIDWDGEYFWTNMAYRVKPAPPKPLDGWVNIYGDDDTMAMPSRFLHPTKESADANASPERIKCVHVREVIDE